MPSLQRNLSFGWWSLLLWLLLGMALEALHGFKVGWYLDVANDARRLQLTLAHTHGTLIAVVNLAFYAVFRPPAPALEGLGRASWCLVLAGVLMPAGFLLGGLFTMGPDPGFGVVLVPVGGVLLFLGVLLAARASHTMRASTPVASGAEAEGQSAAPQKRSKKRS